MIRRFFVLVSLICCAGSLAACSSETEQPATPMTSPPATPTSPTSPPEPAETQKTVYLGQAFRTSEGMKCRVDDVTYGPGENKRQDSVEFTIVAWNRTKEASGDCSTYYSFNSDGEWHCQAYVWASRGLRVSYPDTSKCQVPKGTRFKYSEFYDSLDGYVKQPGSLDSVKVILRRPPRDKRG